MAISISEVQTKFTAEFAEMRKALDALSGETERRVAKANAAMEKTAATAERAVTGQAKKLGSALGNISNLLGAQSSEIAQFGSRAIGVFGAVRESIAIEGGLNPAIIGIGGALALILPKISEFGEAFQSAITKAAGAVQTVLLPELDNALKAMEQKFARTPQGFANPTEQTAFNKIVNDYAAALNRAGLESQLTGDKTAELQARLNAAKTAFLDIKTQVDTTNLNGYSEEFQKLLSILEDFKKTQREIQLLNATAGPPADLAPQEKKQAKPKRRKPLDEGRGLRYLAGT